MLTAHEIIKRYGDDPEAMTRSLLEYADLAALIRERFSGAETADSANIRATGDSGRKAVRIGIKPNLVCPTPASYGATTHPEIVCGIIRYLQEHGFDDIVILEGSWVGDRTAEAYEYCGYRALCEKTHVAFFDTQKDSSHEVDVDGHGIHVCDIVDTIDYLINVPVLKGHCQTKATCALKNLKGLIPNSEKRRFHTMGLHDPIARLSRAIRQDFIVIDHICGDPSFEEGGNPFRTDCVMAALDPVLADSYGCRLLGLKPEEVPYIGMAARLGSGRTDLSSAVIRILNEKNEEIQTFRGDEEDPEIHFGTDRRVLDVAVPIDDWDACSACYASFAAAVFRLKQENRWDETAFERIAIGQGHRGRTGDFGIGNCCRDFDRYIPGCPPSEEDIIRAFCSSQHGDEPDIYE